MKSASSFRSNLSSIQKGMICQFFGSLVGPVFYFSQQLIHANSQLLEHRFVYDFGILMWPTKVLALGSTDIDFFKEILLILSNTFLYLLFGYLLLLVYRIAGSRAHYYSVSLLIFPIVIAMWIAGFDVDYVAWIPLGASLIFYAGLGLLTSHYFEKAV